MADRGDVTTIVYVGTYTQTLPHVDGKAAGIYVYRLDRTSGELHHLHTTEGVSNPSFVAVEPHHRYLFAVEEVGEYEGQPGGMVCGFVIDPRTYGLTPINRQRTQGAYPCYVSVDQSGRWLLVANHGGGSVSVLPISKGGVLGQVTSVIQHQGTPEHKQPAHPHSIIADPSNRFVLVADAGLDRIYVYQLDLEGGVLTPNATPWLALRSGTGPRHLVFDPDGRYLYCINETASSIGVFSYDVDQGILREIQTVSSLPEGFAGRNAGADVHSDPTGRWLYGSNRGDDSIAIFIVDGATGTLQATGHRSTGGRIPRGFAIDPAGRLLLAANQNSDTVVTFWIDPTSGGLTRGGGSTSIPTPVCLCIADFADMDAAR
ncbi:MAG: lactonase family protein [Herpetosiphonaceae bacterium]|nr:lactonase family protein [Herpetosiphonaceae bacterium]